MKSLPSQRDRLLSVLRHGTVTVMSFTIIATTGIGVGVQHSHHGHSHHGHAHHGHSHPHAHGYEHKHGGPHSHGEPHLHVAILGINLTLLCFGDRADARVQKSVSRASGGAVAGSGYDASPTFVDLNGTPVSLFQVLTFVESIVLGRLDTPAAAKGFSAFNPVGDFTGCDRGMPPTPPPELV